MNRQVSTAAVRAALVYLILSILYIYLSDELVRILAASRLIAPGDPTAIVSKLQTYKGVGFVLTTSILLFIVLRAEFLKRELAQFELAASEAKYRLLAETTPDIIILHDMQGRIKYINQAGLDFTGINPSKVSNRTIDESIPQEYQVEFTTRRDQRAAGDHRTFRYEVMFTNSAGKAVPVEIHSMPVVQDNQVDAILVVMRDISERKQAEQVIHNKLAQLRALHEIDKTINSTLDLEEMLEAILHEITRIVRCDSMSLQILRDGRLDVTAGRGFDRTDEILRLAFPLDPKYPNYLAIKERKPIAFDDVTDEYPHFKDQATQYYSGHIRSWLGIPMIAGEEIIGVLTFDRKTVDPFEPEEIETASLFAAQAAIALQNAQLYEGLKDSEANYRSIFEGIQDAIYVEAQDGTILDANERACELYGFSREEFLQLSAADLIPEGYPSLAPRDFDSIGETKAPFAAVHRRADGTLFPVEVSMRVQEIADEKVSLVVVRDISERKRAEEQIQRQLNRLEAVRQVNLVITGILDLDDTLEIFLEHLTIELGVDAACILLLNPESQRFEFATSNGFESEALRYTSLALAEGSAGVAAETQSAYFIPDLKDQPDAFKGSKYFHQEGFKSYYAVPMISRGKVSGVIELFHRSRLHPDDEWRQFLEMLSAQAAIAIDNATLFSQLQQHSAELEVAVKTATFDLRESRDRLEAILNNSPDAVLLLSPDGTIEQPNAAVDRLFGHNPDELIGQSVSSLLDPALAGALDDYFGQISKEKQTTSLEGYGRHQDGSSFDAEVILAPIMHASAVNAVVCTIRDVTAWQKLQRMKDAFVSNVSHELRTPITSMRLNYGLLKVDPENPDKYMDRLDREIHRLDDLIEDLLRLSRLDSDSVQLQFESVDLNELTAATVQDRSPLAVINQLELSHSPDPGAPQIYADGSLLAQALSVIMTNALNYTPSGGHIEVGVTRKTDTGDDWVGFYVQDDGPGIPAEDQPHLFERFYRGEVGRASGAPGTGLGLAIAHEIVQRIMAIYKSTARGSPAKEPASRSGFHCRKSTTIKSEQSPAGGQGADQWR
ncbi:MAG: PAS domain S-box protein [Anaerolineales bacterium]|nr:PAS domain S-box protein [Anaerolineales bacterium]